MTDRRERGSASIGAWHQTLGQDGFSAGLQGTSSQAYAPPVQVRKQLLALEENADGSLTVQRCLDAQADDVNIQFEAGNRPVTAIAPQAFRDCRSLRRVVLPDALRMIGEMAFSGCSTLQRIVIPGSVQRVGTLAFARCTALEEVWMESGVAALGPSAFSKCEALTRVEIPESVVRFGGGVFFGCGKGLCLRGKAGSAAEQYANLNGLVFDAERWKTDPVLCLEEMPDGSLMLMGSRTPQRRLEIPEAVCGRRIAAIAPRAFLGDRTLEQLIVGSGVREIGEGAFMGCSSLMLAAFERGLVVIGDSAFAGCGLQQVLLPYGTAAVGRMAFFGCSRLSYARMPAGTRVGALAFDGCAPGLHVFGGVAAENGATM